MSHIREVVFNNAEYFFDNSKRLAAENYVPTTDDYLLVRAKTSGIHEAAFTFNKSEFIIVDVGGQRSERRKWIHCFEKVTAIIFCMAINEYDKTLREDETTNRLIEALELFDEITNAKWFQETPIITFLNKYDLFEKKMLDPESPDLKVCFPEYQGGKDLNAAISFIKNRIAELNKNQNVYIHLTVAIDKQNMKLIFDSVRDSILHKHINHNLGF